MPTLSEQLSKLILLLGIVFFVFGIITFFIGRSDNKPPQLQAFSGTLETARRFSGKQNYLQIIVKINQTQSTEGKVQAKIDEVEEAITKSKENAKITIYKEDDDKLAQIWRIDLEGKTILSVEETATYEEKSSQMASSASPYLFGIGALIGILGFIWRRKLKSS
jgi:alpha-glucosidase (family GH31 glycosyl hydrolase)